MSIFFYELVYASSYVCLSVATMRTSECIGNAFAIFPYLSKYLYTCKYRGVEESLLGSTWTNFGTPRYAIIKHIHYEVRQLRWEPKKRTKKAAKVSR